MQLMRQIKWEELLRLQKCSGEEELATCFEASGAHLSTINNFLTQLYQHCTMQEFTLPQKQETLQLALSALRSIVTTHSRQEMIQRLDIPLPAHSSTLSNIQHSQLIQWMRPRLIQHYELYDTVLDSNPHFVMEGTVLEMVPKVREAGLGEGRTVQVEEIEVLGEFVGVVPPKEEKKDPKKK